ncbi:replication endonuclease [Pseudoteredinibacter isoporae]|uniref:replication endonuclease n=1 Tax=Pseudoteredinibacter isoporae TaxID=570281 RepID=UPI003340CD2B
MEKEAGYVYANQQLRKLHKKLTLGPQFHGIYIDSPDEDVKTFAKKKSLAVLKLLGDTSKHQGEKEAIKKVIDLVNDCGLNFPLEAINKASSEEIAGAIARCCDDEWWRRQIRRHQDTVLEHVHIEIGLVNKTKGIYCSNFMVERKRAQHKRNMKTLSLLIAENDLGESLSLLELAKRSTANLVNRRNELMTRISGFEEIAKEQDHVGIFYTLTAPSCFHACLSSNGKHNPRYKGYSPAETQKYLNTLWRRTRAKLKRQDIQPYGVRVVEPHHDGTPHWHLLLFVPKHQEEQLTQIMREYALAKDPNEPGARQHRFKVEHINPNKGSAVGYIAKYIAKNIDGEHVGEDNYGKDAIDSAARIRAWASTWNFRQFQFIGGPSVTVWRESRRLANSEESGALLSKGDPDLLAKIVQAADQGDWRRFVSLCGGPQAPRKAQPLRAFQVVKDTLNKYGELCHKIIGLLYKNAEIVKTRFREWQIKLAPVKSEQMMNECFSIGGANAPPLEFCQ